MHRKRSRCRLEIVSCPLTCKHSKPSSSNCNHLHFIRKYEELQLWNSDSCGVGLRINCEPSHRLLQCF
ncbi:mCG147288 [Mus musculus]|nr:mCG147288 [Mus musculus]